MKRIIPLIVLVVCLLFFLPNGPSSAQQTAQKEMSQLEWRKLGEGVQVLRLWESNTGPKWPEIAILRLSAEEYKEFLEHPVDYLNDHKVYPPDHSAKRVIRCRLAPVPQAVPGKPAPECAVIAKHDPDSTSVITASCKAVFYDNPK